jgi:alpha-1,3-rhamnosyl/mannosyltransferase
VVGAAGVLLDPDDAGGLAQAMRRVSQDEGLRAALSAASLARAGEFSWARFISGTVECYRKACAERP